MMNNSPASGDTQRQESEKRLNQWVHQTIIYTLGSLGQDVTEAAVEAAKQSIFETLPKETIGGRLVKAVICWSGQQFLQQAAQREGTDGGT